MIAFAAGSACSVLAAWPAHAAAAGPASALAKMQLPDVQGPVPVTEISRPYLSAGKAMADAGYVEEEYFLSGSPNIYEWVGKTKDLKVVSGPGRYVNRILVGRPRDASRFSGNSKRFLRGKAQAALSEPSGLFVELLSRNGPILGWALDNARGCRRVEKFFGEFAGGGVILPGCPESATLSAPTAS